MKKNNPSALLFALLFASTGALAQEAKKPPKAEAILENIVVASGPKQVRPLPRQRSYLFGATGDYDVFENRLCLGGLLSLLGECTG